MVVVAFPACPASMVLLGHQAATDVTDVMAVMELKDNGLIKVSLAFAVYRRTVIKFTHNIGHAAAIFQNVQVDFT